MAFTTDVNQALVDAIRAGYDAQEREMDGKKYFTKQVFLPPNEPRPCRLELNTLQGLVDYLESEIDAELLGATVIQVVSESEVHLIGPVQLRDKGRNVWVEVDLHKVFNDGGFRFGTYYDAETFNIMLQAHFVPTEDRDKVLKMAGNLTVEAVQTAVDDGTTQTAGQKKGVVFQELAKVPNPVLLAPYRTFREIAQPISPFVFRVKQEKAGDLPKCALFEADGNRWKLEAIKRVKDWLTENLSGDISILA